MNETRIAGVIADAFAVRASMATASTLHAQHGVGIFVALEADVTVAEPGRAPVRGRVVVVPQDVPHAAFSPGPTVGLLYDPELTSHVATFARAHDGARALQGPLAERMRAAASAHGACLFKADVLTGLAREFGGWLAGEAPRREPDRRVARALEALREPTSEEPVMTPRLGISPSHLQALFVRDVGVPMRTFRLWRRLLGGLSAFQRMDATAAAHLVGFSDLPHFSRTCRRMLGYTPTVLRDGGEVTFDTAALAAPARG